MSPRRLPDKFVAMLDSMGLQDLKSALETSEPCTSVRLNRRKGVTPEELSFEGSEIPWAKAGLYLDERPRFTFDPMFHQGCYYVQEASSMFHGYVVGQLTSGATAPLRVLDSCAAPGGKTTAAIDALPEGSLVVANEYVPARAAVLRENVIKWSYPACVVTRGDTASFRRLKDTFDIIIADVPCSGEGMMRKDDEAVSQWTPGLIRDCVDRQWEIVGNIWQALKPGGCLIYSTCTFNRNENEEMIERIIDEYGAESVEIPVDPQWGIAGGIATEAHCYRFMPGRLRGEGLFVAVVRKPGEPRPDKTSVKKDKGGNNKKNVPALQQAQGLLTEEARSQMEIYMEDDRISAFPRLHLDLLKKIKRETDVIHEGISIGNVKGRDLIPSQSLALAAADNVVVDRNAFGLCEISRDEALAYLAGEAVALPESTPRGFVLLTFAGRPIGFVKNIGNRSNNLYPTPWRIKSKIN